METIGNRKDDLLCPWCGEPVEIKTDSAWGHHDDSWIECVNRSCAVQPRGRKLSNETWTPGRGTTSHAPATRKRLVEAWKNLKDQEAKGCNHVNRTMDGGCPDCGDPAF